MKDKKKILGFIGIVASAIVSTMVSTWMTDREIGTKVDEALAKRENEES